MLNEQSRDQLSAEATSLRPKDGATITSLRKGGLRCELFVAVLHR